MSNWQPSVTVAALVEREGRFLLVEENTRDGLRLNQPAGHLEPGESLLQAVSRETLEETAFRVRPMACVGVYMTRYVSESNGRDVTYLRFAFACELLGEETGRALDAGIVRALWLTPDEVRARVATHRSAQVMKAIDDYLSGCRYPLEMISTHPSCIYADHP
jgi:8-oxo-dGTP pyrophosphatase MutT (NUDIX family)